jgi:hypothetical protein
MKTAWFQQDTTRPNISNAVHQLSYVVFEK